MPAQINDCWNPTAKELSNLIDACLPVDNGFLNRVFEALQALDEDAPAILNVLHEFQEVFASRPDIDSQTRQHFDYMVNGFESTVEYN